MKPAEPATMGTVTIPPEVMARQVGDETVILDLTSGRYFGLDPVGTRIWHLMVEGKALPEICDAIAAEYDVTRAEAERDLQQLLFDLKTEGLIQVT
jgi:hypothetical protein